MTEIERKIKLGMKLQELHDEFCPDYEPDWDNDTAAKYYIFQNLVTNKFSVGSVYKFSYSASVWFPDMRIAYKICNMLNGEKNVRRNRKDQAI